MNAEKNLVYVQGSEVSYARPMNVVQVKRYRAPLDITHSFFSSGGQAIGRLSRTEHEYEFVYINEILNENILELVRSKCFEQRAIISEGFWIVEHTR